MRGDKRQLIERETGRAVPVIVQTDPDPDGRVIVEIEGTDERLTVYAANLQPRG